MQKTLVTVPAHIDGSQICLDADVRLEPDTRLLVTILAQEPRTRDTTWNAMRLSEASFARVWANEEDAVYDQL